jgi:hypothetical protein
MYLGAQTHTLGDSPLVFWLGLRCVRAMDGLELNIVASPAAAPAPKAGRSVKRKAKAAAREQHRPQDSVNKRFKGEASAQPANGSAESQHISHDASRNSSPHQAGVKRTAPQPAAVKRDYKAEKLQQQQQKTKSKAVKAVNGVVDFYTVQSASGKGAKQQRKRARTADIVVPATQQKVHARDKAHHIDCASTNSNAAHCLCWHSDSGGTTMAAAMMTLASLHQQRARQLHWMTHPCLAPR